MSSQIFSDAIWSIHGDLSSVEYGIKTNDANHVFRNWELAIDRAFCFSRVFVSVPHYSRRFFALAELLNTSRSKQNDLSFILRLFEFLKDWRRSVDSPVASPVVSPVEYKQVELFDDSHTLLVSQSADIKSDIEFDLKAREKLSDCLIETVPFRALTIRKLESMGFFLLRDLFALSLKDLRSYKRTLSRRDIQDIVDTLAKYGVIFR